VRPAGNYLITHVREGKTVAAARVSLGVDLVDAAALESPRREDRAELVTNAEQNGATRRTRRADERPPPAVREPCEWES
jgi:hypothetical protein